MRTSRWSLLAVPLALVLVVAACDSDTTAGDDEEEMEEEVAETGNAGPPKQPIEVVTAAATKTEDAGSSAFELTGTSSAGGFTTDVNAEGAVDYTNGNFEMTLSTEVPGFGALDLEQRFVDDVAYMRFGDLSGVGAVPGIGDGWISFSLDELGIPGGAAETFGAQPSPTEQLDQLRAAGDVEEVGTEEVRGQEATHYTVALDYQAVLDQGVDALGETLGEEDIEYFSDLFEDLGDDTTVDVWITDDGLPVRYAVDTSVDVGGEPVVSNFTMEFFDYGIDVSPEAPPADEVMSFDDLFGGLDIPGLGGSGGDIVEVPEGIQG